MSHSGQARRVVGTTLGAIALLLGGLVLTSTEASGAPGNLPAPLGQANNAGVVSRGCDVNNNLWPGFDAAGLDFAPVAVKIQTNAGSVGRVWVTDFRNSGGNSAGRLYSWPNLEAAVGCTPPDRQLHGLDQPEGIAFDNTGNMYLTDTFKNRVLKYRADQLAAMSDDVNVKTPANYAPDRIWSGPNAANPGGAANLTPTDLWFPRGIDVGPDGKVYVTDDVRNRIAVYVADGANDQVPTEITGLCSPKALAFMGNALFVANFQGACDEVVRLGSMAPGPAVVAASWDAPIQPVDLTTFGTTLLVADVNGGITTILGANAGNGLQPDGTRVTSVGKNGVNGTYDLDGPIFGLDTIAANGNPTLVADSGNFRVLNFDPTAVAPPADVATTTDLSSAPNPSAVDQNVTFTATVTPNAGNDVPTGSVQFYVDTIPRDVPVALDGAGVATKDIVFATPGDRTVSAIYTADAGFDDSDDDLEQQVNAAPVVKVNTTTELEASDNPSLLGEDVTFTATVEQTAGNVTPTGTVQFRDDGEAIGAPVALVNGEASVTTDDLDLGGNTISADYSGSDAFNPSDDDLFHQVVEPADDRIATTTVVTVSPTPNFAGEDTTFTATVTQASGNTKPGGAVQFQVDGFDVGLPQALVNGVASITTDDLSAGNHAVKATYAGNDDFLGSVGTKAIATAIKEADRPTAAVSAASVVQGGQVTVTGSGWPANASVRITLESDPVLLATVNADAQGRVSKVVAIPATTTVGAHTIVLTNGGVRATAPLQVTAAPPSTTSTTVLTTTTKAPVTTSTLPRTGAPVGGKVQLATALLLIGAAILFATWLMPAQAATRRRR